MRHFLFISGIILCIGGIFSPSYNETQINVSPIIGKIESFEHPWNIAPGGDTYILKLNNYKSKFVIRNENYFMVEKKLIEDRIKKGDSIKLIVQKNFIDSQNKSWALFGLSKGKTNYFTKDEALSEYKNNSNALLIGGGLSLLISLILYFLYFFKEKYY